jgi:hypothetical protein
LLVAQFVRFFDLAATDRRKFPWPIHAAVSSLGIHHLDDRQKQRLFLDFANMLVDRRLVARTHLSPQARRARLVDALPATPLAENWISSALGARR